MKKLTLIIATILVLTLTMSTFADTFSDIPENHWAYEAMVELYNLGIYEGYPDGTFKGDNALTRYEMAMVITRTLENINEKREETLYRIEALAELLNDLQLSLNDIEQTQADDMSKLENIEDIQENIAELQAGLENLEEMDQYKFEVVQKDLDSIREQLDTFEGDLGDKVDVDTIASIEEKIESIKKSGLNTEQAQDVTAIVRAMLKENDLAQGEDVATTQETIETLQDLIEEFEEELDIIDSRIQATNELGEIRNNIMGERVDELEERVEVLEEPVVTFNGEYGVNFTHIEIETDGTPLEAEEGQEYYYKDPYNAESGWYEEQLDEDTDHENSGDPDYRLTDEGDYYDEADSIFENTFDLNIGVNKGSLSADIDMTAMANIFGTTDDDVAYELDTLEGTITTPDFTATVKDEQEVSFKDYLYYDETTVDGVVVNADDDVYFLARNIEELKEYYADVDGEEDDYYSAERGHTLFGARKGFDLIVPFNVYVGYEYAADGTFDLVDDDGVVQSSETVDEVKTTLVGLDTATEMAGFDITSDVAFNLGETSDNGHLFRLGAAGDLSILDVAFNYENTADMIFIEDDAETDKQGYDLKLGTTLGPVTGSWEHADYTIDGDDEVTDTIRAEVPEGEVAFAGIDVDGSYKLILGQDDSRKEIRNINATTDLAGIGLAYTYDYDADNELYDETLDRIDNGNNLVDGDTGFEDEASEEDEDTNTHTFAATYGMGAFTLGATAEMAKDMASDDVDIEWENEFENTYTFTGRYTQDMFEAGFEKVLDGDLTIDGSVTAPTLTLVGVDFDSSASYKRNVDQETQNIELNVDAAKDVSDKLALTGGATWADKNIADDVDFAGQKTALGAGVDYSITEDIAANADFNYMSFDADSGESYTVKEATAGVSIAF